MERRAELVLQLTITWGLPKYLRTYKATRIVGWVVGWGFARLGQEIPNGRSFPRLRIHPHRLPDMAIGIIETAAIHEA
jgi:hypothetical protein